MTQALILRGSRDFTDTAAYQSFVDDGAPRRREEEAVM